ncbi:unnamed protein product, partial [Didymodactylos carnosus]
QVLDRLILEYKEVLSSIDSNLESLSKLAPEYITNLSQQDVVNICPMTKIDDSNLLYE